MVRRSSLATSEEADDVNVFDAVVSTGGLTCVACDRHLPLSEFSASQAQRATRKRGAGRVMCASCTCGFTPSHAVRSSSLVNGASPPRRGPGAPSASPPNNDQSASNRTALTPQTPQNRGPPNSFPADVSDSSPAKGSIGRHASRRDSSFSVSASVVSRASSETGADFDVRPRPKNEDKQLLATPTKRQLRTLSGGNILLDDVFNRIKFDSGLLPAERFHCLVEQPGTQRLCSFVAWDRICMYGEKCRYYHPGPEFTRLKSLDGSVLCAKGSMTLLSRRPLLEVLRDVEGREMFELSIEEEPSTQGSQVASAPKTELFKVAYVEFAGKVVWARDSGTASRKLWEKFVTGRAKRHFKPKRGSTVHSSSRSRLMRGMSGGGASVVRSESPSSCSGVSSINPLIAIASQISVDMWLQVLCLLDVREIYNALIAFSSTKSLRDTENGGLLDDYIWEAIVWDRWAVADGSLQRFVQLFQATAETHAVTVAVATALRGEPSTQALRHAVPALAMLPKGLSSARAQKMAEPLGGRLTSIRYTQGIVACGTGGDTVHLLRKPDLARISSTHPKLKNGCEFVDLPARGDTSVLLHAGTAGLFWRDTFQSSLPIVQKVVFGQEVQECLGMCLLSAHEKAYVALSEFASPPVIRCFDLESSQRVIDFDLPPVPLLGMSAVDENCLVSVSLDRQVHVWDVRTGDAIVVLEPPARQGGLGSVTCFSAPFGAHQSSVALGFTKGIGLLDYRAPCGISERLPAPMPVRQVSFSRRLLKAWMYPQNEGGDLIGYEGEIVTYDSGSVTQLAECSTNYLVTCVGQPLDRHDGSLLIGAAKAKRSGRGEASLLVSAIPSSDINTDQASHTEAAGNSAAGGAVGGGSASQAGATTNDGPAYGGGGRGRRDNRRRQ